MSEANPYRYDDHGEWKFMGQVQNYVVARRKGCAPSLFARREWDKLARLPISPGPSQGGEE